MKILIATPCYGGVVQSQYTASLVRTVSALTKFGADYDYIAIANSDIVHIRNEYAHIFMSDPRYTHLLFIDSDMAFDPESVIKLLQANTDVIGHVYPKKTTTLLDAVASARKQTDDTLAVADAMSFVVRCKSNQIAVNKSGLASVDGIGMGLSLIRKSAFEKMAKTGSLSRRPSDSKVVAASNSLMYGFFDQLYDGEGNLLSEDLAFCERYRNLTGGEVWAVVSDRIGHVGSMTYIGAYFDRLRAGRL